MIKRLRRRIGELKAYRREHGWKALLRHVGWVPVVLFIVFYLIRDTILYVLVPLAVWMGLFR